MISRLNLKHFRNFAHQKIEFSAQIVLLIGANGVGKTNILEALTLLGRGGSLRGDDFEEMIFDDRISGEKKSEFTIYSEMANHQFIEKIGLSFSAQTKKKILQINGETLSSKRQGDLKNHLVNFVWLTPQLEQLFILGKTERRDYLDKIVSDLDPEHLTRLNNYQKLLRERLLILQKHSFSTNRSDAQKWLEIVENKIVELAVAIASARLEAIDFFNRAIADFASNFPRPKLQVIGEVEQEFLNRSAVNLEEFCKNRLAKNRQTDLENFRTEFGVHRADFDAIFLDKKSSATRASTGEQKAIMIGITLARAKISAKYKNQPTVLIFDEVVSHLDDRRKSDLFSEIKSSNLQTFLSATSLDLIPQQHCDDSLQLVNLS